MPHPGKFQSSVPTLCGLNCQPRQDIRPLRQRARSAIRTPYPESWIHLRFRESHNLTMAVMRIRLCDWERMTTVDDRFCFDRSGSRRSNGLRCPARPETHHSKPLHHPSRFRSARMIGPRWHRTRTVPARLRLCVHEARTNPNSAAAQHPHNSAVRVFFACLSVETSAQLLWSLSKKSMGSRWTTDCRCIRAARADSPVHMRLHERRCAAAAKSRAGARWLSS